MLSVSLFVSSTNLTIVLGICLLMRADIFLKLVHPKFCSLCREYAGQAVIKCSAVSLICGQCLQNGTTVASLLLWLLAR